MDELIEQGWEKIHWMKECMPVLGALESRYAPEKPLSGKWVSMAIHPVAKTAHLALAIKALDADEAVTGSHTPFPQG